MSIALRTLFLFAILPLLGAQEIVRQGLLRVDYDQPVQEFSSEKSFRAVGLIPVDTQAHFHVSIRHSQDGLRWSEATPVELNHEGGALYWIEGGARFVSVSSPADVRVLLIEPGAVAPVSRKARGLAVEAELIPRAGWGCGAECTPRSAPAFAPVTHLVVHHSAGANQASNWAAVVRSIWVLHVQGNGWNDVGYNYLIDPNGVIYEGRAGGDGVIGAHFSGVNTGTMGVCLMGTYSRVPATPAAVDSLRRLLGWQAAKWKLDPSGQSVHRSSGLTLNTISGHRDAGLSPNASGATECPGNALYSYLPDLRKRVSNDYPLCRIALDRRNYCVGASGASLEVSFENPGGCTVGVDSSADWIQISEGKLVVSPNSGARRSADLSIGGLQVNVAQAEAGNNALPCPSRGAVVNAASFDTRPLGRGSIATLFGQDLWREGATTRVLVNNNLNATVAGATPNQVNFILPGSVNPGSARLVVERGGVRSPETMFWVTEAAPAVFLAQNFADGAINAEQRPVKAGEALIVYVTGIGTSAELPWEILWNGSKLDGLYLGPTPGFPGLAQANLLVPANASAGVNRVQIGVSGVWSQEVPVFVSR